MKTNIIKICAVATLVSVATPSLAATYKIYVHAQSPYRSESKKGYMPRAFYNKTLCEVEARALERALRNLGMRVYEVKCRAV